jgi:hypothetical protein
MLTGGRAVAVLVKIKPTTIAAAAATLRVDDCMSGPLPIRAGVYSQAGCADVNKNGTGATCGQATALA